MALSVNTATIDGCIECKDDITNKEWKICPNCGRKYSSYKIPKSREIFATNIKNYGIIIWLLMTHIIVLRDVLLVNETNWWSFISSVTGIISAQIWISNYILKNIHPKIE